MWHSLYHVLLARHEPAQARLLGIWVRAVQGPARAGPFLAPLLSLALSPPSASTPPPLLNSFPLRALEARLGLGLEEWASWGMAALRVILVVTLLLLNPKPRLPRLLLVIPWFC